MGSASLRCFLTSIRYLSSIFGPTIAIRSSEGIADASSSSTPHSSLPPRICRLRASRIWTSDSRHYPLADKNREISFQAFAAKDMSTLGQSHAATALEILLNADPTHERIFCEYSLPLRGVMSLQYRPETSSLGVLRWQDQSPMA